MRLGAAPEVAEAPGQFWKDFIRDTAPVFRTPTIEQLEEFIEPTFRRSATAPATSTTGSREIFDELQPALIVEDNVVSFPAIREVAPGRGSSPATLSRFRTPPSRPSSPGTRLATASGGRSSVPPTSRATRRSTPSSPRPASSVARRAASRGSSSTSRRRSTCTSIPAELDYARERAARREQWHRLDSCVREVVAAFELPELLAERHGRLVYVSLGSLGSADVDLMRRLVEVLSASPHRFIVSKGPQHEELELAANMWGEELLPQPAILPLVDLVITHAGNNTTTECLHMGKPTIALPLFWDQMDNAQRLDETGLGLRLAPYTFEPEELLGGDRAAPRRRAVASAARCDGCEDPGRRREDAGGRSDRSGCRRRRPLTRPRPRRRLAPTMNCSPTAARLSR